MNVRIFLSLAGGLGLFLFGMDLMSDSIEKVAGARLRRILEFFTTNRFTGMLVGIVFTGIIQSSSACTAMVVSFVNAGLMNLYQAAGVIFGANIGTTVTSQLVSFNLSAYAPVILLAGVLAVMFCKNEKVKKFAEIVIGFGVGVSGDAEPEGWLLSLYSLIAIFVNSRVLAFTIDGASYDKLLFVISDFHSDEFREFIIGELNRSATYIKAHGMYSRDEKEMIFLVVSRNEVKAVQRKIKQIDPRAFLVVTDAYDTFGEGFKTFPKDDALQVE